MSYIIYTRAEKEQAARTDLLAYIQKRGYPIKEYARGYYKIPGYGGLLIQPEKNAWYWEAKSKGGGPVQFVIEVEKKTWAEAIDALLSAHVATSDAGVNYIAASGRTAENSARQEVKEFRLPPRNDSYKHIFAYLMNVRRIHQKVIQRVVHEHRLYEDMNQNCVFVGYDASGIARFASLRGTGDALHRPFKGDVAGSDKRYPFCVEGCTGTIFVFEAAIDLLSLMTLQIDAGQEVNHHYISLSGVSLLGLAGYLDRHPAITDIICCTDYDEDGERAWTQMQSAYDSKYRMQRLQLPGAKDINEYLVSEQFRKTLQEMGL